MTKFFGGNASRFEVYGLFLAAVVLIGGGISGAIVVTNDDQPSIPVALVETTTSIPATSSTTVPIPPSSEAPTTTVGRSAIAAAPYLDPPPSTTTPSQPIQDYTAFCEMRNFVGDFTVTSNFFSAGSMAVGAALDNDGCLSRSLLRLEVCYDSNIRYPAYSVTRQDPAPGTLVHRTMGTVSLWIRESTDNTTFPPERACS